MFRLQDVDFSTFDMSGNMDAPAPAKTGASGVLGSRVCV